MARDPAPVLWTPGDGTAGTARDAAVAAGRADLVVVMPGVEPLGDWLARLVDAARSDTAIATASAMLSGGAFAPSPLPAGDLAPAAASVAERSARLRPRISEPHPGCVLLRRRALDAAGYGDERGRALDAAGCGDERGRALDAAGCGDERGRALDAAGGGDERGRALDAAGGGDERRRALDGDGEDVAAWLAAFGERCTALGLVHVLADDVLAAGPPATPHPADEAELAARHPHRTVAREFDARPDSPVEHALLVASRGLDKLSVTIDARALGPARAGTQVHALELVAALGRTGALRLRIVTPPDLHPEARAALEEIEDLTLLPYEQAANESHPPTDVVHRPSQVFSPSDLALLLPLGRRMVVTHQDLIAYRIPSYHERVEDWERYRRVTRSTLAAADHVVFFSEHALRDAAADQLVDPRTSSVVPIGVDHRVAPAPAPRRPTALPADATPYLLCLGADLRHKHHAFAIALTDALRDEHGWAGRLVFAGPTGSTGADTTEDPATVVRLGPVAEDEKAWLLEHAAAVAYPTLYEGFGLIPFEAAAAGVPCLFAAQTALAEVLPVEAATLVPWDPAASALAVAPLLQGGSPRETHVAAVRAAARRFRWDDTAHALVELFERVIVAGRSDLRRAARERAELEELLLATKRERVEEWQRYEAFRESIGSDGLGLVGPGGVLDEADQRALLSLLSRPALRRPATKAARAAYALAVRLQRRG
jgi:glycosyltransferase involved in cell wall biosynthesis